MSDQNDQDERSIDELSPAEQQRRWRDLVGKPGALDDAKLEVVGVEEVISESEAILRVRRKKED